MEKNRNNRSIIGKYRTPQEAAKRNRKKLSNPSEEDHNRYSGSRPINRFEQRRRQSKIRAQREAYNRRAQQQERIPTYQEEIKESQSQAVLNNFRKPLQYLVYFIIVILCLLLSIFLYARFSRLNPDLSGNLELYNISTNAAAVASSHRIANVAVFGTDGREDVEGERSDTIMIGSADFEHNKLKVTSLLRDTYTLMAGEDFFDKLNAAYALGGPEESLKTINENFDTALTDYVVIDFTALVALVNAVGGVDITLDEEEVYWTNQYLMDVNEKVQTNDPFLENPGAQRLTGSQALAYARIRYTGNGDYDRTQRQRNILEQVVAKASAMNPIRQLSLIQQVMPYIKTSLSPSEIFKYALNVILMPNKQIEQSRLPADGMSTDGMLDGVSYVFPNTLVDNIKNWYRFVYEIDYTPSTTAQEISTEIEEAWWN